MTKEQKELTRTYILVEAAKYIYDNKKRFSEEIQAKYGFSPEEAMTTENDNKDKQDARDDATRKDDSAEQN